MDNTKLSLIGIDNNMIFNNDSDSFLINARILHDKLGNKKHFSDWIKFYTKSYSGIEVEDDRLEGFASHHDFCFYKRKAEKGRGKSIEYILSLDTAKEIAMMNRTPVGKEVRRYFIQAEKNLSRLKEMMYNEDKALLEYRLKNLKELMDSEAKEARRQLKKVENSKEYNKKENVSLRRTIKDLKGQLDDLISSKNDNVSNELMVTVDEENDLYEEIKKLEEENENLQNIADNLQGRLDKMTKSKVTGKKILEEITRLDIARRTRFATTNSQKEDLAIKAYTFRKNSIIHSGVKLIKDDGNFIDRISPDHMSTAIDSYLKALSGSIKDADIFNKIFDSAIKMNAELENSLEEIDQGISIIKPKEIEGTKPFNKKKIFTGKKA